MNIVKKMIAFDYFPKDIPSEFYTEELADSLDNINFSSLTKNEKEIWAKPVYFSVPKNGHFRRIMSIPSPLHQVLLCQLIVEKWEELNDHFNLSTVSMTTPIFSQKDDKAIESRTHISQKMHIRINHLFNKNYILQTDISRYYSTIYTHVIPWALHTKEYAKKNIGKKSLLGNKIDNRVQWMQDGQTFGIPTGPITSQIISEIIGTSIDRDFRNLMGCEVHGFRYTDDIEYYFDSEESAKNALYKLQKVVNQYQLELHPTKTRIIKSPIEFEPEWKHYFSRFNFSTGVVSQLNDITAYFSKAFAYKHGTEDKGVLTYAIKKIRNIVVKKENWDVYESLLLHTAFSDSKTLPLVIEIIEGYNAKNYPINIEKIENFIEELIKVNFTKKNHYEVSWALVFAKRLNISIKTDLSKLLLTAEDSVTCILTMILHSKKLLEGYLDFSNYKRFLNKEELYGSNWLFAYEAFKQGWLKPYSNPNYVFEDSFFKQLFDNNVSFLSQEIDVKEINELIKEEPGTEGSGETEEEQPKEPGTEGSGETEEEQPEEPGTEGSGETEEEQPEEPGTEGSGETEEEKPEEPGTEGSGETEEEKPEEPGTEDSGETEEEQSEEPEVEAKKNIDLEMDKEKKLKRLVRKSIYKRSDWLFDFLDTDLEKERIIVSDWDGSEY